MSFNALISFTAAIIGCILVAIILWRTKKLHVRMLAFSLFCYSYTGLLIFLFESRYILDMPYFFRTAPVLSYLCTPALFLYFIIAINKRKGLRWTDLLHLIPAIIYIIDFAPILLSSNETKKAAIQEIFNNISLVLRFHENWLLPNNFHYPARHIIALCYLTYMGLLLARLWNNDRSSVRRNRSVFNWLVTITAAYSIHATLAVINFLVVSFDKYWYVALINSMLVFTTIAVVMFMSPSTLYGSIHTLAPERSRRKIPALTDELASRLKMRMEDIISRKVYLQSGITIKTIADEMETKPYLLSAFINEYYGMHFNDLINFYRIGYVKERLMNNDLQSYTLEAIAQEAGFNNRTSFLNAFKKFTGVTPSSFVRGLRNA